VVDNQQIKKLFSYESEDEKLILLMILIILLIRIIRIINKRYANNSMVEVGVFFVLIGEM